MILLIKTSVLGLMALIFLPSCFNFMDLKSKTIDTALLDEPFEYTFVMKHGWSDFLDNSDVTQLKEGDLPQGMVVSANRTLEGTPTQVGSYDFKVIAYDVDRFNADSGFYSLSDSEWFFFFVTEVSTNENCPLPNIHRISEIYICLGKVSLESLGDGDSFSLDVNFYVNLDESGLYNIDTLDFTIVFDEERFLLDEDLLNSSRLREAATFTDPELSFDTTVPGELGVVITAMDEPFLRAGRLLDLSFTAIVDLDEENYDFNLVIEEISASDIDEEADLPEDISLDGSLTLTDVTISDT